MSSSIVDLLAAISTHLAAFELPPVDSIHITAGVSAPQVTVQLTRRDPAALAQGLLAWADTLTRVTAHKWQLCQGDSVHLSITGSLPDATVVLVYGGLPAHRGELEADLCVGTTTLPLAALRQAATTQEASA
ncbi:MAG TPA: hypothetical protein VN748_08195 [Pseudonocardiaceae bacterium]|jgi:hypothetical protein|nr:hypothetical protein [Pseudonocardiaceae bacterium]